MSWNTTRCPPEVICDHLRKKVYPVGTDLVHIVSGARNDPQKAEPIPTGYLTSSWQQHLWQFRDKWDSSAVAQSSTGSLKETLLGSLFPLHTPVLFPSFFKELSYVWISLYFRSRNKTTTMTKISLLHQKKGNSTSTKIWLNDLLYLTSLYLFLNLVENMAAQISKENDSECHSKQLKSMNRTQSYVSKLSL